MMKKIKKISQQLKIMKKFELVKINILKKIRRLLKIISEKIKMPIHQRKEIKSEKKLILMK